jgi:hypothetical protein
LEVDKNSELRRLKKRWVTDLIIEVQKVLNNKELKFNDVNTDLSKQLQEAFTFCNNEYPAYSN